MSEIRLTATSGWRGCARSPFLRLNGEDLSYGTVATAYELVIAVTTGELTDVPDISGRMRKL